MNEGLLSSERALTNESNQDERVPTEVQTQCKGC